MIYHGDCRTVMLGMAPNSVDAVVTDPPYGLEFMGKGWDAPWKDGKPSRQFNTSCAGKLGGFTQLPNNSRVNNLRCGCCGKWKFSSNPCQCENPDFPNARQEAMRGFQDFMYLWATAALRVLKPGGYLMAFGGTRTHHRLWCAIEDAGFEIRDTVMWVYGSGFPKSHNLKGEWHGFGTALKPAYEPICVARKPLDGTVAENVQKWGVGAMDIDGCRVMASPAGQSLMERGRQSIRTIRAGRVASCFGMKPEGLRNTTQHKSGRWPANLIHDGSEEALELFPQTTTWQGERKGGYKGTSMFGLGGINDAPASSGSAARFFYCAKASRSERGADNKHPTVKPLALMRYLVNLVSRPGHIVLDPFMGSGTTGIACRELGREFIGIDNNAEYCQIAERRIAAGAQ